MYFIICLYLYMYSLCFHRGYGTTPEDNQLCIEYGLKALDLHYTTESYTQANIIILYLKDKLRTVSMIILLMYICY